MRGQTRRLILFAVAGLIALVAAELFSRAFLGQNRDTVLDVLVADPIVGYRYASNVTTRESSRDYNVPFLTNGDGIRDRDYGEKGNAFRILLIGNSFCVSHGVSIDESFSRQLETALSTACGESGRPIEVINTANAGYNAYNYWKSYARWAPVFDPDVVVVGFVPAREYMSDPKDIRFVIREGLLIGRYRDGQSPSVARQGPVFRFRKFLARNSDLYVLIRNFVYYNDHVQGLLGPPKGGSRRRLVPYLTPAPESVAVGRQRSFDYLAELNRETTADGVPLLVVGVPQKSDALDSTWGAMVAQANTSGVEVDRSLPWSSLADFCRDSEIWFVETVSALHEIGPDAFFELDNHWNSIGISTAAEEVAKAWRQKGMAPCPLIDVRSSDSAETRQLTSQSEKGGY